MKVGLSLLIILIAWNSQVIAATRAAVSTARADVLTAYNACSDGDTLAIPVGTATYSSPIDISKQITVQGAGVGQTILKPSGSNAVLRIYKATSVLRNVRITGIEFQGNGQDLTNEGLVQIGTSSGTAGCDNVYTVADFRIDHCQFTDVGIEDLAGGLTGNSAVTSWGYCYGVIDHNVFQNCYGECLDLGADGTGDNPANPVSLQRSLDYGGYTNGTIYIEDNTWNYTLAISPGDYGAENAFDGNSGSRWVIRYKTFNIASNTLVQALISNHETCAPRSCDAASQGDVGSLMMEIYGNTINNNGTAPNFGVKQFVHQRGGKALIYNNTFNSKDTSAEAIVRLSNFRSYHRTGCGCVHARGYAQVSHEAESGYKAEGLDAAKTALTGAISENATTITVADASGLNANGVANGYAIRIGSELIEWTGVSGNQLTGCLRGRNGTSAASHPSGASVDYLKFGVCLEQINNTYIWGNRTVGGASKNTAEIGGDFYPPDYSFYDIQSFAQRPNNWQYREGTAFSYTPHPYPHPLIASGGGQTIPVIAVSPAGLSYGSVAVGSTRDLTFTVRNVGTGTLTGTVSVAAPFSIVGSPNYSLASNVSQVITVRYAPTAVGSHSQNVTFSGGGGAVAAVTGSALSGSGGAPTPLPGLSFEATAGTITAPFSITSNNTISQSVSTDPATGGSATYEFNIASAGDYIVTATVLAPSEAANSFFVNIDAEPTDPTMIWDIPVSSAATTRMVTWRGTGPPIPPATPHVWQLAAGKHTLIIRGREGSARLGTISISANSPESPSLSFEATTGTITAPFSANPDNTISQSVSTDPTIGGSATYAFNIASAGDYIVTANVLAPSEAANSFFVNIDAEPTDPTMIWDIPVSSAATTRMVTWRGTGPPIPPATPHVWQLAAGKHTLIIRGREGSARLGTISISANSPGSVVP